MRPRTPTMFWIPFVFSIGTISWGLLLVGLALMSAVLLAPAFNDLHDVEVQHNDYQATLDLLDQKIALQKDFLEKAKNDPVLMQRLAVLQLNIAPPGEMLLTPPLNPDAKNRDRSIETLLAQSLVPTKPAAVREVPKPLVKTLEPVTHRMLIIIACAAMALSFFLGVKYERN